MAWSRLARGLVTWLAAAAFVALAGVAAWTEVAREEAASQTWLVPVVGVVLAAAGWAMQGPPLPRVLLVIAAVAWLAGSLSMWLLLVHQGVLLWVLLAAGTGAVLGWDRLIAVLAVPTMLGMLAQPAVGAVFVAVAARLLTRLRTPRTVGAAVMGFVIGGALIGSWLVSRAWPGAFDPRSAVLAYEGALVAATGALVLGSRAEASRPGRLVDRLVAGAGSDGLVGLGDVLQDLLRARGLQVVRDPIDLRPHGDLPIVVGDRVAAVVRDPVVDTLDGALRDDIAVAVGLVLLGEEGRAALDAQATALEAAQRRMTVAQDQQRAATAARLRDDVVAPLRQAAELLGAGVAVDDPLASDAVGVAREQIDAATSEIEELIHGAGPRGLGKGGLVEALRAMARRSPVPVDVRVDGELRAPEELETALFYVCAEALVNVHRHARATAAVVTLGYDGTHVRLVVSDDGIGGADTGRPGLTGLADRVALHGGRLHVDSPRGAGTRLEVELPTTSRGQVG